MMNCKERGCGCSAFNSDFLCAACDQHWERHKTFFETERERREKKLPFGAEHRPFYEMQELKQALYDEEDRPRPIDHGLQQGEFRRLFNRTFVLYAYYRNAQWFDLNWIFFYSRLRFKNGKIRLKVEKNQISLKKKNKNNFIEFQFYLNVSVKKIGLLELKWSNKWN